MSQILRDGAYHIPGSRRSFIISGSPNTCPETNEDIDMHHVTLHVVDNDKEVYDTVMIYSGDWDHRCLVHLSDVLTLS